MNFKMIEFFSQVMSQNFFLLRSDRKKQSKNIKKKKKLKKMKSINKFSIQISVNSPLSLFNKVYCDDFELFLIHQIQYQIWYYY